MRIPFLQIGIPAITLSLFLASNTQANAEVRVPESTCTGLTSLPFTPDRNITLAECQEIKNNLEKSTTGEKVVSNNTISFCIVEGKSGYKLTFAPDAETACNKITAFVITSEFIPIGEYQSGTIDPTGENILDATCNELSYNVPITGKKGLIVKVFSASDSGDKNCKFKVSSPETGVLDDSF